MKAATLLAFGSPLSIGAAPNPVPGTGEVIVDVVATGILPYAADVFSGARKYPLELPVVPGCGAVGRVRTAGPDATRLLSLRVVCWSASKEMAVPQRVEQDRGRGRDDRVSHLVVLWPFGIGAALLAVVVFGLFINAPESRNRYNTPQLLWFVAIYLVYWMGWLWTKTSRGEMPDDPIIFAVRDRGSCIVVLGIVLVTLAARFLTLGIL